MKMSSTFRLLQLIVSLFTILVFTIGMVHKELASTDALFTVITFTGACLAGAATTVAALPYKPSIGKMIAQLTNVALAITAIVMAIKIIDHEDCMSMMLMASAIGLAVANLNISTSLNLKS